MSETIQTIKLKCLDKIITIRNDRGIIVEKKPFSEIENFDLLISESTIDIYSSNRKNELILKETIKAPIYEVEKNQTTPQPNQKPTKPMEDQNTTILNMMLQQKQSELDRTQKQYDNLVDELRKSKEKIEQLQQENIKLEIKGGTADKEKELALLAANATYKSSLNGVLSDLKSPETLSGLAQLITAFKGGETSSSNNQIGGFPASFSEQKKLAAKAILEKFETLDESSVTKLTVIINNMTDEAIEVGYEQAIALLQSGQFNQ